MNNIGENIRIAREKAGLTQDELAQKLGYKTRSSIAKIENGTNDIPQSKIILIAEALNTTPAVIMGLDEQKNTNRQWYEIEEKLKFIGYKIGFYEEDAVIWIEYPNGSLEVTEKDLLELNKNTNDFLKFKLNELKKDREKDFKAKQSNVTTQKRDKVAYFYAFNDEGDKLSEKYIISGNGAYNNKSFSIKDKLKKSNKKSIH